MVERVSTDLPWGHRHGEPQLLCFTSLLGVMSWPQQPLDFRSSETTLGFPLGYDLKGPWGLKCAEPSLPSSFHSPGLLVKQLGFSTLELRCPYHELHRPLG